MPNDNDLIERYLYAITRRLPVEQRADVANELRTLISDMLDERCGSLPPVPKDVRVVLTELGTPSEMVRKYTDGEAKCLIGQPYYASYLSVLKIVLACVSGSLVVAGGLSLAAGGIEDIALRVLEDLGGLMVALACAFSFVTVLFAFFSHRGIEVEVMDSLDDLPLVPRQTKTTTRGDAVAGIIFSLVGAGVFLLFPDVLNALTHGSDGLPVEVFNVDVIHASAWAIIAWMLVCVAAECFKLVEGCYTVRLLVVSLVADAVAACLVVFWLSNYQIIDSQVLVNLVQSTGETLEGPVLWAFENAQAAFCGLVLVALAIDAVDTTVKTLRTRQG